MRRADGRFVIGILGILGMLGGQLVATAALAAEPVENFPLRPVRIVLPFTPGGGTDVIARKFAPGMAQAHSLMVNYLDILDDIEKNHEAYAQQRTVVASKAVSALARAPARDVVPVGG